MDVFRYSSVGGGIHPAATKRIPNADMSARTASITTTEPIESPDVSLHLRSLMENARSTPVVDNEKVHRVANAIVSGRYQIDPQNAAERFIKSEMLTP